MKTNDTETEFRLTKQMKTTMSYWQHCVLPFWHSGLGRIGSSKVDSD